MNVIFIIVVKEKSVQIKYMFCQKRLNVEKLINSLKKNIYKLVKTNLLQKNKYSNVLNQRVFMLRELTRHGLPYRHIQ